MASLQPVARPAPTRVHPGLLCLVSDMCLLVDRAERLLIRSRRAWRRRSHPRTQLNFVGVACDAFVMSRNSGDDHARVGLVCVHGIGMQAKDSMSGDVHRTIELAVEELDGRVELIDAGYTDRADLTVRRILIELPGVECFELDIYDAWWDQLVRPPTYATVMKWLIRTVPFVVLAGVVGSMEDLSRWREQTEPNPRGRDRVPVEGGLPLLVSLVVTPLIYLALPIVVAVSRLPKKGAGLRQMFTHVLGDAWLYKSGDCDRTAIPHIASIVESASQNSDVTMLLGHSQGAELSRQVAGRTNLDIDTCIWVGSGQLPLTLLRTMTRYRVRLPLALAVFLTYPAAFTVFFSIFAPSMLLAGFLRVNGLPEAEYMALGPRYLLPFAGVILVTILILVLNRQRRVDEHDVDADCRTIAIKSPLDPVAFGPLEGREIIRYIRPSSRPAEWVSEHTSYFEKPATGRIILEAILGSEIVPNRPYQPKVARWFKFLSGIAMMLVIAVYLRVGLAELHWLSLFRE